MIVRSLTVITATTIATTPLLWSLPRGQSSVMIVTGVVATFAAALSSRPERANRWLIGSGLLLALSGFVWSESTMATAVSLGAGYLFYACGLTPRLKRWVVRTQPAIAVEEPAPMARAA